MRTQMKKVEKMLDNTCPAWYFNTGIAKPKTAGAVSIRIKRLPRKDSFLQLLGLMKPSVYAERFFSY